MQHIVEAEAAPTRIGEDTRVAVLDAALKEFAARGFDAATIRDIAARAGLSHGMIRYHYKTKEQLWFATVAFLFERQRKELRFTDEELRRGRDDSLEMFRIWLRKYVRYCARHPEHARIMMQESVAPSTRLEKAVSKHLRGGHAIVRKQMKGHIKSGLFPKIARPESVIYIITGACQNIFALAPEARLAFGYDPLTREAIEAHAETVVAMFCPPDAQVKIKRKC